MALVDSEQLRAVRGLRLLLGPVDGGWVEHQWLPRIFFRQTVWQFGTAHVQQQWGAVRKLRRYQGAAQRSTDPDSAADPDTGAADSSDADSDSTDSTDSNTDTADCGTDPASSGFELRT